MSEMTLQPYLYGVSYVYVYEVPWWPHWVTGWNGGTGVNQTHFRFFASLVIYLSGDMNWWHSMRFRVSYPKQVSNQGQPISTLIQEIFANSVVVDCKVTMMKKVTNCLHRRIFSPSFSLSPLSPSNRSSLLHGTKQTERNRIVGGKTDVRSRGTKAILGSIERS